jgi:azurin
MHSCCLPSSRRSPSLSPAAAAPTARPQRPARSHVPHDIAIQGNGVDVTGKVVTDGGTSTVTANLDPGTYTFLCTVDGHADAGMKGTLTVR